MHHIKRKAERYILTYPVTYKLPGDDGPDNNALILNISSLGACIITPYELKPGDKVNLESNLSALSLPAEVRWIQLAERFFFRAGLEFKPQNNTDKTSIKNLISVVKKFSTLISLESRQLQMDHIFSEYISKCTSEKEIALSENETLLRNTIESTADGILVVNNRGEITHANKRFAELWHIPQQLIETKNDQLLLDSVLEQLINPEAFLAKVKKLYQSRTEDMDTLFFKDGRVFERFSAPLISKGTITGRVWSFRDITAHKQAEVSLKKSEEELKSIFRAAPVGIGLVVNRIIKAVNAKLCSMTGYRREELLDQSSRMLYPGDEEFAYVGSEKYRQISESGTGTVETRWIRKDGTIIHIILSSTPIDPSDLSRGVTFTALDITERKKSEELIRLNEARQRSLVNILQYPAENIRDFLDYALNEAIKLTNSRIGYIYHYHEEQRRFVLNSWSRDVMKECAILKPETCYELDRTGLWGEAVRQKKPIILNDFPAEHPLKKGYPEGHAKLYKYLTIPVFSREKIVAVLGVANKETDYDDTDILQLTLLTDAVWKVVERKQAETALRESEERQKVILESIQAGILLIDAETHVITDVNPAAAKIIGLTRDKLLGSVCHKHICPAEVGSCPITDLKQQVDNSDRLLITADGTLRSILKTVVPVAIHGRKHLLESFIDITDRKQAEKERLLNETRIASLLELSRMTGQADKTLTDFALEKAIELTGSTIGYLAFMNEDETVLTMYSWSRQAMRECLIESKPLIYPVEKTGLWGEAVRQRKPIITNDYAAPDPVKKGYPEGHVHVKRHMNIPLFDGEKIVLVAGVGNKEEPYGESDIRQLTLLMDGMWKIIKQKRADEELHKSEEELYKNYSTQALINILLSESLKDEPIELILRKALNMILAIPWLPLQAHGRIFLVEDQPDTLVIKVRSDMTETSCSLVSFGRCLCGRAALSQEMIISHQMNEHHDCIDKRISDHSDYAVPIVYSGRTLGVIHMFLKEDTDTGKNLAEFLDTIANTLAGIIERSKGEKERQRLQSQLLQAQKMEAIGTLAGGIAHDFNNLLMGILGYTSLMLMKTDKFHPFYEKLKIIEQQVDSGTDLTRQLLGFARGGKYEVKPFNINELIIRTSDIFGRTRKEISIQRKMSDDPLTVEADRGQIEQVLLNLFVNAWQAMPSGGDLFLETQEVFLDEKLSSVYSLSPGNYAKISVTDTGTGMDEDTQKRIFEPFFTTKEVGRGTGLGLASAYGIIKNHNGAINVYSEKGHGTTFTVYLPATNRKSLAPKPLSESIITGNETILFADDEKTNITTIKDLLETLGYKVYTAQSGQRAIELFRENMEDIDLVILDMVMPGMNGKETLKKLMDINQNACVLLSSGYSLNGEAKNILELGCKGFIQKPFRIEELSQKIREILDKT